VGEGGDAPWAGDGQPQDGWPPGAPGGHRPGPPGALRELIFPESSAGPYPGPVRRRLPGIDEDSLLRASPGPATDAWLAEGAATGDADAFGQLYRRHLPAARWAAQGLTGSSHDAADAANAAAVRVYEALAGGRLQDGARFRSYFLVASRHAALDQLRRSGRVSPTDRVDDLDSPCATEPLDQALADLDARLVSRAFRQLPERWQMVLWLTAVEGVPVKEAAGLLGLSASGVAQLALRARAGLRRAFVQAHVDISGVARECAFAVERLGPYATGASPARDTAKIDQHLAACPTCRGRLEQLEELGWKAPLPGERAA
jgi:RNA polymerase sigma factor (sigma-70 family)